MIKYFRGVYLKSFLDLFIFWLIIINIITFLLILVDKRKNSNGMHGMKRIEIMTFGFLGAAFTIFLFMIAFNYKSKRLIYMIWMPVFILLHAATIVFLIFKG